MVLACTEESYMISWQDILMLIIQFGFVIALIPSVRSETRKPARLSCAITGVLLVGMVVVVGSWNQPISAGAMLLTATVWFILLFQRRD